MKKRKNSFSQNHSPLNNTLFFSKTLDFLETYIPKQSNGSRNTIETYRIGLSQFRDYIYSQKKLSIRTFKFCDCTYDFILDYRNWLHDIQNYKESTTNNRLAAIRSYVNYAAARDVTLQQTAFAVSEVPMYKTPKKIRPIIEQEETLAALLNAPANTRIGLRDKTIMVILFDTAIRVEELIKLDYADVNLSVSEPYIHVHGKGNKERKVYFSERTIAIVKQYVNEFHSEKDYRLPFFFTIIHNHKGHMSRRNVERIVKKYADQIRMEYKDLPDTVYPHLLRRTRATGLYQDGIDITVISTLLGHSQLQTTKDHYIRPSIKQLQEAMEPSIITESPENQLWPDDEDELAKLCGLR